MTALNDTDPRRASPVGTAAQREGPIVGSFQIVRELGRGGMGVVYMGVHRTLGQRVALKVLREDLLTNQEIRVRFEEEARIGANIRHPNVVQIIDLINFPDGRPCIVMEYCEGRTLDAWAGREPMAADIAVTMLEQVCGGLAAAHRLGIVHRDIKGDNVIVTVEDGAPVVKLADFGIAKLSQMSVAGMTAPGTVMGTPHYMSPEQARGEKVDARADVYAVGILAYRLLMGKLPFSGNDLTSILVQHLASPPPEMVGVSIPVQSVVLRTLAKNKADRYADAGELRKAFGLISSGGQAVITSPPAPVSKWPVPREPAPGELSEVTISEAPAPMLPTPEPLRSKPAAPRPPPTPIPPRRSTPDASTPSRDGWTPEAPTSQRRALTPRPSTPLPSTPPPSTPEPKAPTPPERHIIPAAVNAAPGRVEIIYPSGEVLPRIEQAKATGGQLYVPHSGKIAPGHVAVSIQAGDQVLQLEAEIAVVFGPEEGIKFNLPPGFALAIRRNAQVTRATKPTGTSNPGMMGFAAFLSRAATRIGKNHFEFLAVPPDAEWLKLASAIDFLQRKLDEATSAAGPADLKTLAPLRTRLEEARNDLTEPANRLRYSAKLKNYQGIARAIRDNVDLALLANLHAEFIKSKPKEESEAKMRELQAGHLEREGQFGRALEEITAALKISPLSFTLHRRYAELQRLAERGAESRSGEQTPGPGSSPFARTPTSSQPVRQAERTPGPGSAPGKAAVSTPNGQNPVQIMRNSPHVGDRAAQVAERSVPLGWKPAPDAPTPIPGRLKTEPTRPTPLPAPPASEPADTPSGSPSRRWWPKK